MGIDRLFNTETRKGVAWFGIDPPPDGRRAFEERGFVVTPCSVRDLYRPGFVEGLAAVIFTQNSAKLAGIARDLKRHAARMLTYDCRVIIRTVRQPELDGQPLVISVIDQLRIPTANLDVEDAEKLGKWQPTHRGQAPLPHARVYGPNVPWPDIANFMMEHRPGPAPSRTLVIEPDEERQRLSWAYDLLLRRAFWDCAGVHLKRMDDGHSGVSVYLAHAELMKGQLGEWPLPYFVKIGDRRKVFDEYVKYEDNVDPYVPFHLGPHLIRERCCLGASSGVIVGDFVEESEGLAQCAREGRAGPAIACLFNRTLAGWHRFAQQDEQESSQLARRLLRRFPRMSARLEPRLARARELGAIRSLDELRRLFQRCVSTPVLVGPIHNDLHAGNVHVRATDAIVIDFAAHDRGPLLCDAATLEASLLVDGFREKGSGEPGAKAELDATIRQWLESIEGLYDHVPLHASLIHPNPKNPACWFHACVRQIRRYAWEMELRPHQYAAALALALLIKATKSLNVPEPEASRRAAAYVLAERVLLSAFDPREGEYCI